MSISIYLTNLRRYNDGELFGKWVELPLSKEELNEELTEVLDGDEEYFISDWEVPKGFDIGEYSNIYALNDDAEEYEYILQHKFLGDEEALSLCLKEYDDNLYRYESADIYRYEGDMSDVAKEYVNTYPTQDIPDIFIDYFNFEAYGEYLKSCGGNFVEGNGFVVEIVE